MRRWEDVAVQVLDPVEQLELLGAEPAGVLVPQFLREVGGLVEMDADAEPVAVAGVDVVAVAAEVDALGQTEPAEEANGRWLCGTRRR
jgi:hypothetical protein